MRVRIVLITICSIGMLLSGCTLIPPYSTMQSELEESRIQKSQADERQKDLEKELDQAKKRIQLMAIALKDAEKARNKSAKDLNDLQMQHAYLKNINSQLSKSIKSLKLELNKKKSVIEIQERVIQLLDDTKKTIETSLKDQIAAHQVELIESEDKLKVIFVDKILFDSGSAEINPKGKEVLLAMAKSLQESENQNILVEGHTDNVPLAAGMLKRFPSNWELSTARASAVAHFFEREGGIQPQKISACGYSFYRPVASNNSPQGRRQNRRIEIILDPVE